MNKTKSKTSSRSRTSREQAVKVESSNMQPTQLLRLFEEELKDIYWAEKALTKAIPKMINNATSPELIETLERHLTQTQEQVKRAERVFQIIGKKAEAKKCESMEGLIKEAEELMVESTEGAMCDAAIISAAQKIEHYEIASYGTLRQFAETIGLNDAVSLLELTLEEEKQADMKLTEVAVSAVNLEAVQEMER